MNTKHQGWKNIMESIQEKKKETQQKRKKNLKYISSADLVVLAIFRRRKEKKTEKKENLKYISSAAS